MTEFRMKQYFAGSASPVSCVLLFLFPIMTGCTHRAVTVEQVDAMVRTQVPMGSDREKVNSFIDILRLIP